VNLTREGRREPKEKKKKKETQWWVVCFLSNYKVDAVVAQEPLTRRRHEQPFPFQPVGGSDAKVSTEKRDRAASSVSS
jgi:hypothetical protein